MSEVQEVNQRNSPLHTQPQPLIIDDQNAMGTLDFAPKRRRRGWLIALVIVLIVILVGASAAAYLLTRPPGVTYIQQAAAIGNLTVTVSGTGPVQPKAEYDMNFTVPGQVTAIDVQAGQQVKAGQTLAQIGSSILQDQVTAAQQKVTAAQVAYNDALTYGASQSVIDQDAQAIAAAQDALKTAQDALAATTLLAPANATVAAVNGAVGQSVTGNSGGANAQPFVILTDTSTLNIAALVNEADMAQVQVGQPAQFTIPAYPSQTFSATVATIETVGQTVSNVVNYTVNLTVNQNSLNGAHIYPGMTATVNIITIRHTGVLLVPSAALSFTSSALQAGELNRAAVTALFARSAQNTPAQGTQGVVLELKNGKLTPTLVTTGASNGQYTEILSGLQAGNQVVVGQTGGNTGSGQLLTSPLPQRVPGSGGAKHGKLK